LCPFFFMLWNGRDMGEAGKMLQIKDLNKNFGSRPLFRDCSLFVKSGERIALVGANGSGKTTLFRIIMHNEPYDTGEIILPNNVRVGFLPQEIEAVKGTTLLTEVMCCWPEIGKLENKIERLASKLAETQCPAQEQILHDYGKAQSRFEALGGYNLEYQAKKILFGLGFKENDLSRATDVFSGGWQMRIALAKLLLDPPELMMLDEPTNHLDLESLLWLQNYLLAYKGTLIFTSHDRDFINQVVTRVIEIDAAKLVKYNGNYEYYLKEKDNREVILLAARKNQERKVEQTQKFINRFRATASRARLVQSKIKALDKMEKVTAPKKTKHVRFCFPQPLRSGHEVITIKDFYKSYGDNKIYEGVDLSICRGDKVAFVGSNGAGKSTLLKILAGVLEIDKGSRIIGHKVNNGYYPQHRLDILNTHNTCLAEIEDVYHSGGQTETRKLLGSFLFSGDDVYKKVSVLSGGEKSRLVLIKILANPPNFLLMDEPINHLDIPSRDILIEALSEFTGTLCFISHDVYFIRKVANKIIEIKDGKLKIYPGGYDYYIHKKEVDEKNRRLEEEPKLEDIRNTAKADRKRNIHIQKTGRDIPGKIFAEIEKELVALSARLEEINRLLSDPAIYKDNSFISLVKEQKSLKVKIDELTFKWESYIT